MAGGSVGQGAGGAARPGSYRRRRDHPRPPRRRRAPRPARPAPTRWRRCSTCPACATAADGARAGDRPAARPPGAAPRVGRGQHRVGAARCPGVGRARGRRRPAGRAARRARSSDPVVQGALRVSVGARLDGRDVAAGAGPGAGPAARAGRRRPAPTAAELGRPAPHAGPPAGRAVRRWSPATTSAPAVLVAALVHGELAALAPVRHGRRRGRPGRRPAHRHHPRAGPQGRLGARGRLRRAGPGRLRRGAGRLRRRRRRTGVAGWLVHCCRATEHGAVEGLAICESLLRG